MRIVLSFFFCTIATWALFHGVFGIHLKDITDPAGQAGMISIYILLGGVGAAFIVNSEDGHDYGHDFYIARIFHKLADLISACTERMRKD